MSPVKAKILQMIQHIPGKFSTGDSDSYTKLVARVFVHDVTVLFFCAKPNVCYASYVHSGNW